MPPDSDRTALRYAQQLLRAHGRDGAQAQCPDEHPALAWARSGAMALTGSAERAPLMCAAPLAACADGALAALAALAPPRAYAGISGAALLGERAAIAGYTRRGRLSPGGSCRLVECADGWIAANLARDDDWALVPAWLEHEGAGEWGSVERAARGLAVDMLIERGRELGLGVAPVSDARTPTSVTRPQGPHTQEQTRPPVVVDLSSLWAGPLCAHLLQLAGAEVIKAESTQRPDGARSGPQPFFDLLNHGKRSVALDLAAPQGREQLRALIARADIVIESSRPRALRQLGIVAEDLLRANPRLTWIAISGYGRGAQEENWIAYGDDAGVAAGLTQLMYQACGERVIVGDAIADPLTGLHAAVAALAGFQRGGGGLVPLALAEVVRACMSFELPQDLRGRQREWTALAQDQVHLPHARAATGPARGLGADNSAI